ncbi:GNAT family N-acetyltransferase [Aquimarina brevivitae]|nr:GNAT family N-acetyltransferase [Aquimarina brevivitae]
MLTNITSQPKAFFELLPKDWKQTLEPYWTYYQKHSEVLVLLVDGQIVAGAIVFRKITPDTLIFRKEAKELCQQGYWYIGFLWVPTTFRGKGYGSDWLTALKIMFPDRSFWLTTEESKLQEFYLLNNFKLISSKIVRGETEYLFRFDSLSQKNEL